MYQILQKFQMKNNKKTKTSKIARLFRDTQICHLQENFVKRETKKDSLKMSLIQFGY